MTWPSRAGSRRTVPTFLCRTAFVGCAVLGFGVGVPAHAAPPGIVVGVAGPACSAPTHPTLIAAVAAAPPGATIAVCPGTYTGTVEVTKPVSLRGAKAGTDARTGRTDPAAESVIDGGGGSGVRIAAGLAGVAIAGFTIRNAGTDTQPADGIDASRGGTAFTFVDNIISETSRGIAVSSGGGAASHISHNRFVANNRSGLSGGTGVLLCCGPGSDLSITENAFSGHSSAAVNTTGDPARLSERLRIEANTSTDDSTFAAVVNATGPAVGGNLVRRTATTTPLGSAILVGGNTSGVQVTNNRIQGGAATGIRVSTEFGPPNTGYAIAGNVVDGRRIGIRLSGQTSGSIVDNTVSSSAEVGILLDADNQGVTIGHNAVGPSGVLDCRDLSIGPASGGTANTWTGNLGVSSAPKGICQLA